MKHYLESAEAVFQEVNSNENGLSSAEAAARLEKNGKNKLAEAKKDSTLKKFFDQMKDPMILVLLGAAALSLLASGGHDWLDAVIILLIVVINSVISISQEDNAQRALEELQKLSSPKARVLRDGTEERIEAAQLVPGDVILLEAGDRVELVCTGNTIVSGKKVAE